MRQGSKGQAVGGGTPVVAREVEEGGWKCVVGTSTSNSGECGQQGGLSCVRDCTG